MRIKQGDPMTPEEEKEEREYGCIVKARGFLFVCCLEPEPLDITNNRVKIERGEIK